VRGDCYRWRRRHVVELNGRSAEFWSYYRPGFWLEMDARDEARRAGLVKDKSDYDRLKLDGRPMA